MVRVVFLETLTCSLFSVLWRSVASLFNVRIFYGTLHQGLGTLRGQYGDGNIGTVAEQQILLKIDKVHTPWPMSH